MQVGNTSQSWGAIQRVLHWTVAAMVLFQLLIGDLMLFGGPGRTENLWFYVHPTIGILIGVLMLARLGWRTANPVPAVPEDLDTPKQVLSQATHYAFYFLLICNPVVGWLLVGALGQHVHFFTGTLPDLMGKSVFYESFYFWLHALFAAGIGGLLLLHAAAAMNHELFMGDNVLRRMLGYPPMTVLRQAVQDGKIENPQWAAFPSRPQVPPA